MTAPLPLSLSGKSARTTDSPITYFIQKALEDPRLISFAAGLVDEASLPAAEVGAAVAGTPSSTARPRGCRRSASGCCGTSATPTGWPRPP